MDDRSEFSEFMNRLVERDFEGFPLDDVDEDDEMDLAYKPKKGYVMFKKEGKHFAS
jgi:hypothetical protein